jgi:hypothetical protein
MVEHRKMDLVAGSGCYWLRIMTCGRGWYSNVIRKLMNTYAYKYNKFDFLNLPYRIYK